MIQLIVEGQGEVEAVPVLLRRLAAELGVPQAQFGSPIRRTRSQLVQRPDLDHALALARLRRSCKAVFILFDADDLCPKTEANPLRDLVRELARELPISLVVANREFEAWFLASQETLGAAHPYPNDPDLKRGAKEELERRLDLYYDERVDQPKFSARLDFRLAYERSRSFRKLVQEFHRLLQTLGLNPTPTLRGIHLP
ncbi:MAG: hypothetical protein RL514_2414 [Verrucomicrobiota bacterium]|jgi:hypothetical protein